MSAITKTISAKVYVANENEDIDYGLQIQKNSKDILNIPNVWDIFISHASAGKTVYPDEKEFVLFLYEILTTKYKKKVYLDLISNPTMIDTEITRAAQRSEYGVFICSSRYVNIFNGNRTESYITEFDRIPREVNIFFTKARWQGKCIIPIRFGLEESAYEQRGPFPGTRTISIEDEITKKSIEKAEFIAKKIVERIMEGKKIGTIKKAAVTS